ncbi:MAG: hypothetical protein OHK0023_07910 [Anaerolineae bacterium]
MAALIALSVGIRTTAADGLSACTTITLQNPHSEACNAEIEANPTPQVQAATELDPKLDGVSTPRSIFIPEGGMPYTLGWILKDWAYSDAPGVDPTDFSPARMYRKKDLVYLFATVHVNGMDWHLIGKDRWMSGEHIAALYYPERPEGVDGQWIAINLTEQTLVAYVDDTPIFATLVSAAWEGYGVTEEGLFQIYARAKNTTFRGPPWKLDNPDYVYNFVPNVQFFEGNLAFHGAYWHDWFGFPRSHGCVNLPVADARWLWNWVDETKDQWGPAKGFRLPKPENAPHVLVYSTPRTGDTRLR